jgi:hypothetical protein
VWKEIAPKRGERGEEPAMFAKSDFAVVVVPYLVEVTFRALLEAWIIVSIGTVVLVDH